jgi:hypothetical protein
MPRVTKQQMKERVPEFARDAVDLIRERLNLDDMKNLINQPMFQHNGWYYYLGKTITIINPEIRIYRENYKNLKDLPKGSRIYEEAWIYKEGANCKILGIMEGHIIHDNDHGFLLDGFSIQDYKLSIF